MKFDEIRKSNLRRERNDDSVMKRGDRGLDNQISTINYQFVLIGCDMVSNVLKS